MVLTPFDDLVKNGLVDLCRLLDYSSDSMTQPCTYVGNRDSLSHGIAANIIHHVFDEDRTLSNFTVDDDFNIVRAL